MRDEVLFSVVLEDLQNESQQILNRKLNDNEVLLAKKFIQEGLCSGIEIVFHTAILEAVEFTQS